MSRDGRGRPRLVEPCRPGATAKEEILDAAGELFTTQGYANTSTRAVADAVGIPWSVADAALRILGCGHDFAELRRGTAERLQMAPVNVTS